MLEYARVESYLSSVVRDNKGNSLGTNRENLEVAAKAGNPRAKKLLALPPLPDTVSYLWDWAMELHGKSGVSQVGFNPLTYETITHWAHWKGESPEPYEIEALFMLDAILLNPPKDLD